MFTKNQITSYRNISLTTRLFIYCFIVFSGFSMGFDSANAAVPRNKPSVGSILSAKGDAQIRFVEEKNWLTAEIEQGLLTGDGLRTGSLGTMALLFIDRTQIQIQRNSILTVKSVAKSAKGNTILRLDRGGTWSRAARGGAGIQIETPSATAAIRGTDWSLKVDDKGSTQLIVLDGEVILENPFGRVSVKRGEIAFAEIGKAPTKTVLVNPEDRAQQIYDLSLVEALKNHKLTELKVAERQQKKKQIESIPASERDALQWVELAELSYDLGDWKTTRQALQSLVTPDNLLKARTDLVTGFLSFLDYDFASAENHFSAAISSLDPARILHAQIGLTVSLLQLRKVDEAKQLIDSMEQKYGDDPRFLLLQVVLTTFSGDFPDAIDQAGKLAQRFPDNPHFPAIEAVLSILLARSEQAKNAAEKTLALDPGNSVGFQMLSEYKNVFLGDSEGAIELLKQGLTYNESDNDLWSQLGYILLMIGEYQQAEKAFLKSIDLFPKDIACLVNYAILLLDQYRLEEARMILDQVEQIDPNRDFTKIFQGRLALHTDDIAGAEQGFLEATTLNPAYSDSALGLAYTYYQKGELAQAEQALDNAARLNPNEPIIPLIGSVIAQDRAYADRAIEYARDAIRLYRKRGGTGVTGLASTRGGNNTLGSAYSNLGLRAWANYYNELSFDPYSAESHFYRATQDEERLSSLYQGLVLEPLATSSRNRFVDLVRRPFIDSEINGSVSWPGNGTGYGGGATVQGFSVTPNPMSYYLSIDHTSSPGDRENADKVNNYFIGTLGINLTHSDRIFLDIEASKSENGLPGTIPVPDLDDNVEDQLLNAGLGYSHYFGARNILLGRIQAQSMSSTFSNEDPLGSRPLSLLDYSLIYNYGIEATNLLYTLGLKDVTDPGDPNSPVLALGSSGPYLENSIPPGLDTESKARLQVESRSLSAHLRHLFTVRTVDITYGFEFKALREDATTEQFTLVPRDPGTGQLIGPDGSLTFLYGDPASQKTEIDQNGTFGSLYGNALWRISDKLWVEGGLFADHADNEISTASNRLTPRAGIAWQASTNDWLRMAYREDVGTSSLFSLAPVATIGLIPDSSFIGDIDSRVKSYIARWDREWTKHFFTSLELRRQDILDFNTSVPESDLYFYADEGRIDKASLKANLWLKGGFGVFASALVQDSENLSTGADNLDGLPLVPDHQFDAGLAWIHPLQIQVILIGSLVGERSANNFDNTKLDSYSTFDFTATWQPLNKHLELGLFITNLLDEEYDAGQDIPASGRNIMITARWRF